ncbi:unnamed protein product [Chondrus crispus]|uniref:Uncharacterized protein n=1 Tax=Chondrus crispus TaxID=2769 RepID=R7QUI4_CHOCR|nr:unnamed protein product [Chondrus crispus]CDF41343.1 unnamed protein product [Chondrus crispus]|eukprot:XP_005711637.1 unnamed protein product [Chondrus crispus]
MWGHVRLACAVRGVLRGVCIARIWNVTGLRRVDIVHLVPRSSSGAGISWRLDMMRARLLLRGVRLRGVRLVRLIVGWILLGMRLVCVRLGLVGRICRFVDRGILMLMWRGGLLVRVGGSGRVVVLDVLECAKDELTDLLRGQFAQVTRDGAVFVHASNGWGRQDCVRGGEGSGERSRFS